MIMGRLNCGPEKPCKPCPPNILPRMTSKIGMNALIIFHTLKLFFNKIQDQMRKNYSEYTCLRKWHCTFGIKAAGQRQRSWMYKYWRQANECWELNTLAR